jgi:light-regulated signal transduction histidine kinase (bacteriophytochrome)
MPFERLHDQGRYPGSGIGLAICRKIAERHGGGIVAGSTLGEGSEFVISLPLRQPRELLAEERREAGPEALEALEARPAGGNPS